MLLRRIPAWAIWVGLLATLALARVAHDASQPQIATGRHLQLVEGRYKVEQIVDPITIRAKPTPSTGLSDRRCFAVRLASLSVNPNFQPRFHHAHSFELARLLEGDTVWLRFDQQRYDEDQTPIAYAFVGDRLLNAELVSCDVALPKMVPGNSARLQRTIHRAQSSTANQRK